MSHLQELEIGLRSIAVPIFDAHGNMLAAMNIGTNAARITVARLESTYLPKLKAIQSELTGVL